MVRIFNPYRCYIFPSPKSTKIQESSAITQLSFPCDFWIAHWLLLLSNYLLQKQLYIIHSVPHLTHAHAFPTKMALLEPQWITVQQKTFTKWCVKLKYNNHTPWLMDGIQAQFQGPIKRSCRQRPCQWPLRWSEPLDPSPHESAQLTIHSGRTYPSSWSSRGWISRSVCLPTQITSSTIRECQQSLGLHQRAWNTDDKYWRRGCCGWQ